MTNCIGESDDEVADKESVEHDREGGEWGLVSLKFKDVGVTGRPPCDRWEIDELSSVVENDDDDVSASSAMWETPLWSLTGSPKGSEGDEDVESSGGGRWGRGRAKRLLSLDERIGEVISTSSRVSGTPESGKPED